MYQLVIVFIENFCEYEDIYEIFHMQEGWGIKENVQVSQKMREI